jgi:chromosome partitioning protein
MRPVPVPGGLCMSSIVIMNAKGGVGKSTLTLALAETLATYYGRRVLMIDADGQANLSLMVMPVDAVMQQHAASRTVAGWLSGYTAGHEPVDWKTCITAAVGDLDGTTGLHILAGDMDLPLVERDLVAQGLTDFIVLACRAMLAEARACADIVLVDCAPGLSIVTECWLRACDWHLLPLKPDLLAISGLEYLNRFMQKRDAGDFAKRLGTLVNLYDSASETDRLIVSILNEHPEERCFRTPIPNFRIFKRPRCLHLSGAPI